MWTVSPRSSIVLGWLWKRFGLNWLEETSRVRIRCSQHDSSNMGRKNPCRIPVNFSNLRQVSIKMLAVVQLREKSTGFPVNSLRGAQICRFWAEFEHS